jgi:hypothetical protein
MSGTGLEPNPVRFPKVAARMASVSSFYRLGKGHSSQRSWIFRSMSVENAWVDAIGANCELDSVGQSSPQALKRNWFSDLSARINSCPSPVLLPFRVRVALHGSGCPYRFLRGLDSTWLTLTARCGSYRCGSMGFNFGVGCRAPRFASAERTKSVRPYTAARDEDQLEPGADVMG